MSETCRLRRGEGYGACDDAVPVAKARLATEERYKMLRAEERGPRAGRT